jgi:hypothetical protein
MIKDIHKRAVEMWVTSKDINLDVNPAYFIIEQLTGNKPDLGNEPQNTVELCQVINDLNGWGSLSENEKLEIQSYGLILLNKSKKSKLEKLFNYNALKLVNWLGYLLGLISIIIGGFTWWIIGLGIGTWWATGAAKMASQKLETEPGYSWEMPVHIIIHLLALIGLIVFSIYNLI